MRFGPVRLAEAQGAVLAHSVATRAGRLRKGTVLTAAIIETLRSQRLETVIVARLEPGEIGEDEAARRVGTALLGRDRGLRAAPATTGRTNLYAATGGLLDIDRDAVDALNAIDPAITLATLPEHQLVRSGTMVATVKIIPFGVALRCVERAERMMQEVWPIAVRSPLGIRVSLIQTTLPSVKESVLDKTAMRLEERLTRCGGSLLGEARVAHEASAVSRALAALGEATSGDDRDVVVLFGASALCDPLDVLPAGLTDAGGTVSALGMPVDPGNLLMLGRFGGRMVIGAPGCARGPALNGFDWVLNRVAHGCHIGADAIARMGVGGLLKEMADRPHGREAG